MNKANENQQQNNQTEEAPQVNPEQKSAYEQTTLAQQEPAYPDISKANTKFVVIASLVCLIALFLLSILIPDTSKKENSNPQSTTGTSQLTTDFLFPA